MWNGFSHIALQQLQNISKNGVKVERLRALWFLARWFYSHGRMDQALECLLHRKEILKKWDNKNLFGLVKCYSLLEQYEKIAPIIKDFEKNNTLDVREAYLKSNSLCGFSGKDQDRIDHINQIFTSEGLLPVRKKYEKKEIALDNFSWSRRKHKKKLCSPTLPLVSVVIPAFNAEDTIHIALESLLDQTWQNLEVIVVDDCSNDNTVEVVKRYSGKYPQIRLIQNEKNVGAYPTRNNGFSKATGEFITVHDGDDWSHPQKIELQMNELLEDNQKVASISYWVRVKENLRFVGSWMLNHSFVELNHSSLLIRRSVIDDCGYWDGIKFGADTEFFWRISRFYGEDAIAQVLPNTPLSFALALDSSLTRTKLTHVKTINYGVRRLYREAARWWHKQDSQPHFEANDRPFQGPLGCFRDSSEEFDIVFATDFSSLNEHLSAALIHAEKAFQAGKLKVALMHWPDFNKCFKAAVDDSVFAFCRKYSVQFTHYGSTIKAKDLVFYGSHLLEHIPDNLPVIEGIENISAFNGNKEVSDNTVKQILRKYFKQGGAFEDEAVDKIITGELPQNYFDVGLPGSLKQKWAKHTVYYGAADRVRNHLSYRLGAVAVENSGSLRSCLSLPGALLQEYRSYSADQRKLAYSNKRLPIEKYRDSFEADRVRNHLSYRVGSAMVKYGKNPVGWIWLPFAVALEVRKFRKDNNAVIAQPV